MADLSAVNRTDPPPWPEDPAEAWLEEVSKRVVELPLARKQRFIRDYQLPTPDAQTFAVKLYAELHKADAEGWDWIAVEKPPETSEWAGVLDRLKRASAPQL